MNKKTLWITETAVLIALLVILQYTTAGFGQIITGSCVNAVLAFSAISVGLSNGAVVAVLSPFFAFMLGIGPKLLPIVPCISAGNLAYVLIIAIICGKGMNDTKNAIAVGAGAVVKFILLQFLVVNIVCEVLPLKEPQIVMFSKMFSWPQLVTAFIGGIVAMLIARILRKAINKEKNRAMQMQRETSKKNNETAKTSADSNIEVIKGVEEVEDEMNK